MLYFVFGIIRSPTSTNPFNGKYVKSCYTRKVSFVDSRGYTHIYNKYMYMYIYIYGPNIDRLAWRKQKAN